MELQKTIFEDQEPTWSGTIVIPENSFAVLGTRVSIMPYVRAIRVRTNPQLVGMLEECKK